MTATSFLVFIFGASLTVWFGLVYWGLTPKQQPESYRGSDYDDDDDNKMSVSLLRKPEGRKPGGNLEETKKEGKGGKTNCHR